MTIWDKTNEVGIDDSRCDVCSKRASFWMRLANGQEALVAECEVVVSPFEGRTVEKTAKTHRPGVDGLAEERVYARALIEAGKWLGRFPDPS